MKKYLEMLKNRIQCIKIQVFLSYVLVLSLSFAVLGFGVAMAARQIMTNQIGSSRIDLLRQISERANTVKTSATTLVGLYRYGIADLTEIPENMDELLQADKRRYSGVFGPIGMDNDPLLVTGQGIYSSFPEQELPPYLESQLWYRRLRRASSFCWTTASFWYRSHRHFRRPLCAPWCAAAPCRAAKALLRRALRCPRLP